jgi:hypothetical protein
MVSGERTSSYFGPYRFKSAHSRLGILPESSLFSREKGGEGAKGLAPKRLKPAAVMQLVQWQSAASRTA